MKKKKKKSQVGATPHLGEVDAQCVGFVLPADVDLRLCAATFALDLRTSRQSEGRLLGDELRDTKQARSGKREEKKKKNTQKQQN